MRIIRGLLVEFFFLGLILTESASTAHSSPATTGRVPDNFRPTSAFCLRGGADGALASIELREVPLKFTQGASSPLFLPDGYEENHGEKMRWVARRS